MASAARAIAWPTPITDVLPIQPQGALLIGLTGCLAWGLALAPKAGSESFGRWERTLNSCQILHQPANLSSKQPFKLVERSSRRTLEAPFSLAREEEEERKKS